jgi:hypothetical protein
VRGPVAGLLRLMVTNEGRRCGTKAAMLGQGLEGSADTVHEVHEHEAMVQEDLTPVMIKDYEIGMIKPVKVD